MHFGTRHFRSSHFSENHFAPIIQPIEPAVPSDGVIGSRISQVAEKKAAERRAETRRKRQEHIERERQEATKRFEELLKPVSVRSKRPILAVDPLTLDVAEIQKIVADVVENMLPNQRKAIIGESVVNEIISKAESRGVIVDLPDELIIEPKVNDLNLRLMLLMGS